MIKTWQERCEEHPDHEDIVNEGMIRARMQEEIDELRQALAQTEQEPVGYINGMHGGYMVFTPINPSAVYLNGTALYTAPPKREWVGYTKEDRERIVPMLVQSLINHDEKTMAGLLNAILIDIEQQLREKNT